ncbi:MAG: nitronate monooxygenase, partial [Alphaproteobacteria bacterium]
HLDKLRAQLPEAQKRFVDEIADKYSVPPATEGARPLAFSGAIVSRRDLQAHIDIALRHPIRLLVSGLGPFAPDVVARAREANVLIGGMCGSVKHARRHIHAGADVVIAQGSEAGGHTGELSTLVLVPQIVDAVGAVPVLAAGGIATGRQLAAVLALGAQGAWMGSVWLTSEETDVDPAVVEKLIAADSTQTIRSRCLTGKPVRLLRTAFEEEWASPNAPSTLPAPLQGLLVLPIIHRAFQNRVEPLMGTAVGQAVGLMNSQRSCRAIVDEMMLELIDSLEGVRRSLGFDE